MCSILPAAPYPDSSPSCDRPHAFLPHSLFQPSDCTDLTFLSEKAKEDGDKPGLEAMLQKILQLYASKFLGKRTYAHKGGEVLKTEKFLEYIIEAPEEKWNKLLIEGLTIGKGKISPEDFYAVIKKRIERILIRTEGGSYQQRILVEYLKGIQLRTEGVVQAFKGPQDNSKPLD